MPDNNDQWELVTPAPKKSPTDDWQKVSGRGADLLRGEVPEGFAEQHPYWSGLGGVVRGAGRSLASTAGTVFDADEWLNRKITRRPTPPADPTIQAIRDFGHAPDDPRPLWESPEKIGFAGGELAQIVGTGAVAGTARGAGALSKIILREGLTGGVGEVLGWMYGTPGVGGLTAIALKHALGVALNRGKTALARDIVKMMGLGEKAPEAAKAASKVKPAPWGRNPPATPPGSSVPSVSKSAAPKPSTTPPSKPAPTPPTAPATPATPPAGPAAPPSGTPTPGPASATPPSTPPSYQPSSMPPWGQPAGPVPTRPTVRVPMRKPPDDTGS